MKIQKYEYVKTCNYKNIKINETIFVLKYKCMHKLDT